MVWTSNSKQANVKKDEKWGQVFQLTKQQKPQKTDY